MLNCAASVSNIALLEASAGLVCCKHCAAVLSQTAMAGEYNVHLTQDKANKDVCIIALSCLLCGMRSNGGNIERRIEWEWEAATPARFEAIFGWYCNV